MREDDEAEDEVSQRESGWKRRIRHRSAQEPALLFAISLEWCWMPYSRISSRRKTADAKVSRPAGHRPASWWSQDRMKAVTSSTIAKASGSGLRRVDIDAEA